MTDYHSEQWLDLTHTMAADVLAGECPWEILADLSDLIRAWGQTLSRDDYTEITPGVFLARDVRVSPTATIAGPCIVGAGSEIRSGAFLRGSTLIGRGCVIGNSTEVKNAILFDGVKAPHFNYIGDSILGFGAHLGAGAILSNMRCDGAPIVLRTTPPISTKRRKLGSVIGDGCEIGCHAVLNPGTILGRGSIVYPLTSVRGVHPEGSRLTGTRGG
ncbi:MAG: UDP-N-acetylglucosamine pyrophosphorylase [Eubacteriales bacterium]|nr:UDP-N-acetylglucosamine pyrophosphorylase [Eubacteriales bacterium]